MKRYMIAGAITGMLLSQFNLLEGERGGYLLMLLGLIGLLCVTWDIYAAHKQAQEEYYEVERQKHLITAEYLESLHEKRKRKNEELLVALEDEYPEIASRIDAINREIYGG